VSIDIASAVSRVASEPTPFAAPPSPAPVRFNFDAGWPCPATFPIDDLRRLAARSLDDPTVLGYTSVRSDGQGAVYAAPDFPARDELALGDPRLREEIGRWLGRRGARSLTAANVVLTSGSAQAIALCAAALVDPGDTAIVEWPTFPFAVRSLTIKGAAIARVRVGPDGLDVDELQCLLSELSARGARPRLLYTIPTHHPPTGAVLPLEARQRVLALAEQWNLVVVEDAVYSDLHFGEAPPPSLLELDTTGRVIQVHSFSKILAPGLRVGWACGYPEMIERLATVREDLGVSRWLSRILASYLEEGRLAGHLDEVRRTYRHRRDVAAAALRAGCGDAVEFELPGGGLYLWVTVDDSVDWPAAREAAARRGVAVRGLETLAQADLPVRQCFRLGYAHLAETELERGIAILSEEIVAARTTPS